MALTDRQTDRVRAPLSDQIGANRASVIRGEGVTSIDDERGERLLLHSSIPVRISEIVRT